MKMKNVAVYTIGTGVLLGVKEDNIINGVFVKGSVTDEAFAELVIAELEGNLHTIHIGEGTTIGERSLTGKEVISSKTVKTQMKEARKQSGTWLVKQVFGELRGK